MPSEITAAAELADYPLGSTFTDRQGDVWMIDSRYTSTSYSIGPGVMLTSPETARRDAVLVLRKWGPLTPQWRPDRPAQPTAQPSVDLVAKVLDIHRWQTMGVTSVQCECGEIIHGDSSLTAFPDQAFREHIAQAILALIVGRGEAEVKAEALTALPLDGLRQAEKVLRGIEHHWPADSVAETVALIDRAAAIRGEQP